MDNKKYCKNKKCKKELPSDCKYKYCEVCRNKRKDVFKTILSSFAAVILATVFFQNATARNSTSIEDNSCIKNHFSLTISKERFL